MDSKEDYLNHIGRMNRFNDFENNYNEKYDDETRIAQFIALYRLGYKMFSRVEIELIQKESLESKIKIQSRFAQIAAKLRENTSI